ncbi:hypothetical protein [Rheinheimera soli]|uniref:HEPN AbiU2-like domain-containing protein n=1 Tax=Rheinheimera soli TaxID=443616 RepID=A0ABU1VX96_9GAMM|nr:hypothetical protein [Rheinheimera soli]MDR7120324.1 hypothetical protein [Rheinheimera soli]
MSDDFKKFKTSTHEDFYKRTGIQPPKSISINRELFCANELKCFEDYFTSLCTDLTIYNQLFCSDEACSVLNEFNGLLFYRIQRSFIEKICLKVACLMDPASSGRGGQNENLSLARLVEVAANDELTQTYSRLQNSYENTGIKIWRNKILAHTDLKTAMGEYDFELKFDANTLTEIIREIQDIFDLIKDPKTYTDIEVTLPFDKDVSSFIAKLRMANDQHGK